MNTVDAVVVAVLLLGALFGLIRGAIRQLVNAVAWVASGIVPYYYGAPVAHLIATRFDAPYTVAYVVAAITLAILAQLVTRILMAAIGRVVRAVYDRVRTVGETDEERAREGMTRIRGSIPDRLLGAIVGGGKWALVVWVALSGVALVARPMREKGFQVSFESSESYKLATRYNAFRIIWAPDISHLSSAVKRLSAQRAHSTSPASKSDDELSHDERMQQVMANKPLQDALKSGDFATIVSSPQVLSLLADPQMMADALKVATEPQPPSMAGVEE